MNQLKAAAFDLDDTLLRDDLSISSFTKEVFSRLKAAGFSFIAASGSGYGPDLLPGIIPG